MKTTYIFFLLSILCVSAFAQNTLIVPQKTEYFLWDDESSSPGEWVHMSDATHTYDTKGQVEMSTTSYNGINVTRMVNTYTNFKLMESKSQMWSMVSNAWEDQMKITYTYDAQSRASTVTIQIRFGTGSLTNSGKAVYLYSGNNLNPETIVHQVWNAGAQNWQDDERDTNLMWSTDASNPHSLISAVTQEFDQANNRWVNKERVNYSYTSTTRKLTETMEIAAGTSWANSTRSIYTYDSRMNVTNTLEQKWTNGAWTFDDETQHDLTYNANGAMTSRITKSRDAANAAFENSIKEVFSDFRTIAGSAEQLPESTLAVFPNPTSSTLRVTMNSVDFREAKVEMFNLQGVKVYDAAIPHKALSSGTYTIPTGQLSSGMYILHIRTDNNKEIARRVVKN